VSLWSLMGLYVASVIGAGFASGQELAVFFVNYGKSGLWGIMAAVLVLTLGSGLVLDYCASTNASSYAQIFARFHPRLRLLLDGLYSLFLLVGLGVMLAGIGAMGSTALSGLMLRLLTSMIILFVLNKGVEGVAKASSWLAPFLVLTMCGFAFFHFKSGKLAVPNQGSWRALEAGILYGSYNLGFSMTVLASIQSYISTRKERWKLALLANLALGICMVLLFLALSALDVEQLKTSFPLEHLVPGLGWAEAAYELLLWGAMYSTAIAHALALTNRIADTYGLSWNGAGSIIVLLSFSLSYFGFGPLIRIGYPILGLVGLWILANLAWDHVV